MNLRDFTADQLIQACAKGTPGAWEEFIRRFNPVIRAAATRAALKYQNGRMEIPDAVQQIYLKFCVNGARVLTTFESRHEKAIFGYIQVVATNAAVDYFRKRHALACDEVETIGKSLGIVFDDVERRITLDQIYRIAADVANEGRNGARNFAIFMFHFRDGRTAKAIAEDPTIGLDQKGVEAVIQRLRDKVREKAIKGLQEERPSERSNKGGSGDT